MFCIQNAGHREFARVGVAGPNRLDGVGVVGLDSRPRPWWRLRVCAQDPRGLACGAVGDVLPRWRHQYRAPQHGGRDPTHRGRPRATTDEEDPLDPGAGRDGEFPTAVYITIAVLVVCLGTNAVVGILKRVRSAKVEDLAVDHAVGVH